MEALVGLLGSGRGPCLFVLNLVLTTVVPPLLPAVAAPKPPLPQVLIPVELSNSSSQPGVQAARKDLLRLSGLEQQWKRRGVDFAAAPTQGVFGFGAPTPLTIYAGSKTILIGHRP